MATKVKAKESLEEALKSLEKDYGKGSVIKGNQIIEKVDIIDTGSIELNKALGIGGWPMGKIIDLFGWESSGKSTLTQIAIGNYQAKKERKVLLIDGENSLDSNYATNLGIDLSDLIVIQLDAGAGEAAYEKAERLIRTGEIGLVVIDSYNSLQPKSVMEGGVSDANIGRHARMLGQFVVQANALAIEYGTTFIFIGQLREKVGVMYGPSETPQGGNALRFYAHVRATVSRSTTKDNSVMDGDTKLGNKTTVKIIKNKLAPPFTSASFNILYSIGIDKIGEILEVAKDLGILKMRAGIVTFDDEKFPEEDFRVMLEDNEGLFNEIKDRINQTYNGTTTGTDLPTDQAQDLRDGGGRGDNGLSDSGTQAAGTNGDLYNAGGAPTLPG